MGMKGVSAKPPATPVAQPITARPTVSRSVAPPTAPVVPPTPSTGKTATGGINLLA